MSHRIFWMLLAAALCGCAAQASRMDRATSGALAEILASEHRSANRARDVYRHPQQTLEFFGVREDMTVVEVWPGAGWYTEILAPLLRERGKLYAAHLDPQSSEYARSAVERFRAKLTARADLYDRVELTTLSAAPNSGPIAPPGSADLVLTFRNLHNWMMFGWEHSALESIRAALKPGGILGIVEHRGDPNVPQDPKAASGYVNEQFAIDLIESVGFKLVARSEINANPKDTKDYEKGVWTLPPTFAAGAENKDRYVQIGESDRFTLKFVKLPL